MKRIVLLLTAMGMSGSAAAAEHKSSFGARSWPTAVVPSIKDSVVTATYAQAYCNKFLQTYNGKPICNEPAFQAIDAAQRRLDEQQEQLRQNMMQQQEQLRQNRMQQ